MLEKKDVVFKKQIDFFLLFLTNISESKEINKKGTAKVKITKAHVALLIISYSIPFKRVSYKSNI